MSVVGSRVWENDVASAYPAGAAGGSVTEGSAAMLEVGANACWPSIELLPPSGADVFTPWAPRGFLFFAPKGLPLFLGSFWYGISVRLSFLKERNDLMPHTFGRPSSGTFGLFFAPVGLPLGFPVYPLPCLIGCSGV